MRLANSRNWVGESIAKLLTSEATPPAEVSRLLLADSYPVDAAISPYAGCGRVFDGFSYNDSPPVEVEARWGRYIGVMVAPGAVHARAAISRSDGYIISADWTFAMPHNSWTTTGGAVGSNIVNTAFSAILNPGQSAIKYLFGFGQTVVDEIVFTGATIDDAPVAAVDRQYELTTQNSPYIEPMFVRRAAGFSVCVVERIADLENL